MNLFDLNQRPVYVRGGETDGRVRIEQEEEMESNESEMNQGNNEDSVDPWFDVDNSVVNVNGFLHLPHHTPSEVFAPYYRDDSKKPSVNLPITSLRNQILDTISRNQVTIITGATGCGKTTQVPQFILDWFATRGLHCNIIVIQPRRVSVITVATRVCEERGWELGGLCGYKVGLTSKSSNDTRLLYMTTGIFLQILLYTKNIQAYTHIIFDEIHEREQSMDFALLAVKKLLTTNSPDTKVILMSATAEVARFSNFFKCRNGFPSPVIGVKARALHKVDIFYLDDLELLEEVPEPTYGRPQVSKDLMSLCIKLFTQFDLLDYKSKTKAAVLVFLPGTSDIEDLYRMIKKEATGPCREFCKWFPIPIYSALSANDQEKAFRPAPPGHRKIVIATNIAESSITIPDTKIVVDFCLTKIVTANSDSNLTRLNMVWASKANLTQRAGRVGRVANGLVYRLIPHSFMQDEIRMYNSPDMTRCLLHKTSLQTVMLGMGDPQIFLADALDPPNPNDVEKSLLILREMGAFPSLLREPITFEVDSLTMLGNLMAIMPVDIEYTRMIVLGYVFSVFKEAIIIAACLSTKGMFASSFRDRMKYYEKKLTWANGSCSDCIAALNAYETWIQHRESGYFERKPGNNELEWANNHCLQLNCLREAEKLVNELTDRFTVFGIEEPREDERVLWPKEQREHVLKLVIAGTYYPNYFFFPSHLGRGFEKNAIDEVSGRDPFRTACFTNFPRGEKFELYLDTIHEYLSDIGQEYTISTNYDRKLFIEFPNDGEPSYKYDPEIPFDPTIPGGISMGVYKAHKIRYICRNLEFMTLTTEDAQAKKLEIKAKEKEEQKRNEPGCILSTKSFPSGAPKKDITLLSVVINHVINPGQFWCSSVEETATALRNKLNNCLDEFSTKLEPFCYPPKFGQMCVVENSHEGGKLYRAKILQVEMNTEGTGRDPCKGRNQHQIWNRSQHQNWNRSQAHKSRRKNRKKNKRSQEYKTRQDELQWSATVLLIDIGTRQVFKSNSILKYCSKLYAATKRIPALAFQCTLTEVRPSPYKNASSRWVPEATHIFKELTNGDVLTAQVFSVVSDITSIYLFKTVFDGYEEFDININHHLVQLGYAIRCRERWMSEHLVVVLSWSLTALPEVFTQSSSLRAAMPCLDKLDIAQEFRFVISLRLFKFTMDTRKRYYRIKSGESWFDDKAEWINRRYMYGDFDTDQVNTERPVRLGGPLSPLELNLFAATSGRRGLSVGYHGSSVNSICLNPYSHDPFTKLFVAAVVSLPCNREGLTINNSTLMPNIPGWAGIIPLLFTPFAELRLSPDKTRYIGALCGLGLDENGRPVYPDHDMEVVFDVNLTRGDLIDINQIRLAVKECVQRLFFKKRRPIGVESPEQILMWTPHHKSHKWNESFFNELDPLLMFRPHRAYDIAATDSNTSVASRIEYFYEYLDNRQARCDVLACEICESVCSKLGKSRALTEDNINEGIILLEE